MTAGMLYLNRYDVESIGFSLMETPDLGGVRGSFPTVDIPGRIGAALGSYDMTIAPRTVTIRGLVGSSNAAYTTVMALLDAIKSICGQGLVEITHAYDVTRSWYGYLQDSSMMQAAVPTVTDGFAVITLDFLCPDPLAYTLADGGSPIAFGLTRVAMPIGTAPVAPRTLITNTTPATISSRIITYRNASGRVIQTMTLAGNLLSGESIDVDHAEMIIALFAVDGTRTGGATARAYFTAGGYIVMRPRDGDALSLVYPTLELNTAETAQAFYQRSWL